jgi:DNA-binding MarR family transcriptional regulator
MNKTVELVNEWGKFEAGHPQAGISDFCRHYLAGEKQSAANAHRDKLEPASADSVLMRIMGRLMNIHSIYSAKALEGTGLKNIEEFSMLNTVQLLDNPRKSEVIYYCLHEISTGTDILNRLKNWGYISEKEDEEDRRTKRLKITVKGKKVLSDSKTRIQRLAQLMLLDITEDDKKLCAQLLKNAEKKFTPVLQQHKEKTFDEICDDFGLK